MQRASWGRGWFNKITPTFDVRRNIFACCLSPSLFLLRAASLYWSRFMVNSFNTAAEDCLLSLAAVADF